MRDSKETITFGGKEINLKNESDRALYLYIKKLRDEKATINNEQNQILKEIIS